MSARGPSPEVREARPDDDAALCELFASISMEADLRLAVERSPSFFALYELQELLGQRVFVGEREGELEGVATLLARRGLLGGEEVPLAYLGDLRLGAGLRGGFFFLRRFGEELRRFYEETGAELGLTAIFDSNEQARRFLTKRSRRFPGKPLYRHWQSFEITNLLFTRRRRPRPGPCEVRRARPEDLPAIGELLARDHAARPFGYPFGEGLLERRLQRWPGLELGDFFCAWRGSELRGVVAPWDAHAVKRFRVLAYQGSMAWIKRAFNLGATLFRYDPLPRVGEVTRYAYLTHQSVLDEDPAVFAQLLDQVYAELHGTGLNFLCSCLLQEDPLRPAYARYSTVPFAASLYLVGLPEGPLEQLELPKGRPGFEMALV